MEEGLKEYNFKVSEEAEGERIDKYLNALMDSLSRSYLQKLFSEGRVTLNGGQVKVSYRVKQEDLIRIFLPP